MILRTVFISALVAWSMPALADEPEALYNTHCADCHGGDRLGRIGPALIPETLKRMRGPKLAAVIANGRIATQMPSFSDTLSTNEIEALSDYIKTPLAEIPAWGPGQIAESLILNHDYVPVDAPVFEADPMNLFLVVETGDHHVSVLDGDRFEVLTRFPTPFSVHGGPKFTPDGRFVFIMSRDGWVQKVDVWALREVARIRAGLNSRNIAISSDGKWLAVANYLPNTLTLLSTQDFSVAKVIDIQGRDGTPSRVSAVYQAPPRESFILALKDIPEVWEVHYGEDPPFYGFVHDHRVEGPPRQVDPFPVRKIRVETMLDDFFFDPGYEHLIGASRSTDGGQVIDLVIGRKVADLALPGLPHLGSGIAWRMGERKVMATPHLREPRLSIIDIESWEVIDTIETLGPGFFLRSHENSAFVWADVFFGPNKNVMHVIDKQTLEIVKTLRPEPDSTVAHVEFDKEGRHALVSIWEDDGAVIVYDAKTLKEVKRLPMRKPSGKYNVWNKITFSDGTSH